MWCTVRVPCCCSWATATNEGCSLFLARPTGACCRGPLQNSRSTAVKYHAPRSNVSRNERKYMGRGTSAWGCIGWLGGTGHTEPRSSRRSFVGSARREFGRRSTPPPRLRGSSRECWRGSCVPHRCCEDTNAGAKTIEEWDLGRGIHRLRQFLGLPHNHFANRGCEWDVQRPTGAADWGVA